MSTCTVTSPAVAGPSTRLACVSKGCVDTAGCSNSMVLAFDDTNALQPYPSYTNAHDPITVPSSMQIPTGIVEKLSVIVPPYNGKATPSNDPSNSVRFAMFCMGGQPSATGLESRV